MSKYILFKLRKLLLRIFLTNQDKNQKIAIFHLTKFI